MKCLERNVDLNDHSSCEEQIRLLQDALLQSQQRALAGAFAASVMHDVNGPLEALGNLVYLAREDADSEKLVQHYLGMAEGQIAHLQQIAKSTLSFARTQQDGTSVDLIGVLESALHMQRPRLVKKRIAVCRSRIMEAELHAHPGELLQIFTNLIANAVDALPEEGTLHLRVTRSGGHFHVLVSDNGSGIRQEQMERMFEPFSTSGKSGGTGLGLWMSKRLVEKHHGRIQHRTSMRQERRGTTFRVSLPG